MLAVHPAASGVPEPAVGRSWRDPLLAWRDRILASQRFQRWAAGFPLTRPIAQRRSRALFDLCAGFVYSQILLACVRLRVFDRLAERPRTVTELAHSVGLPEEGADRLVRGAIALRLLERRRGGRVGLGALGAAMAGNPGIAAMIEHHPLLYGDLADPVALLRGGPERTALGAYWGYAGAASPSAIEAEGIAAYTALMSASQSFIADEVLDAYALGRHRRLLDVGGGDGTFLTRAAARWPELELVLFDLPAVAAQAEERFASAGLGGRAHAVGGDFGRDRLPSGADIVSLVRVVHDHDDATVRALLASVRAALSPGGILLLAEPMAETPGAEAIGDAYFGFYLLAMGSGRPRSAAALTAMLREAGFTGCRRLRTRRPQFVRVLIAQAG